MPVPDHVHGDDGDGFRTRRTAGPGDFARCLSVAAYGTGRFPVVIGGSGVGTPYVVISRLGGLGGVAVVSDGELPFCERLVRAIGSAIGGGHGRSGVAGQVQDQVDNLGLSGP